MHLQLKGRDWRVSDDTVLHLAIAEGFLECGDLAVKDIPGACTILAAHMKQGMRDMAGRAPGNGTLQAMERVDTDGRGWSSLPSSKRGGGGCGAAMRCMAIGLRFPRAEQLPFLIAYSVESSKVTHNNPLGWFGGLVAAFFTSLAVQGVAPERWCAALLGVQPLVTQHLISSMRDADQVARLREEFDAWQAYGESMQLPLACKDSSAESPARWDREAAWCASSAQAAQARDEHFKQITPCKWPGGTGRGACLIAYDALLAAQGSYSHLVNCAMLHGGDNDSTGAIAGAWWGALYGMQGVPPGHVQDLEYAQRLQKAAQGLLELSGVEQ